MGSVHPGLPDTHSCVVCGLTTPFLNCPDAFCGGNTVPIATAKPMKPFKSLLVHQPRFALGTTVYVVSLFGVDVASILFIRIKPDESPIYRLSNGIDYVECALVSDWNEAMREWDKVVRAYQ